MNESRRNIKRAFNDCKVNELRERSIAVELNFKNKSIKSFWKNIHDTKNKIKHSKLIEGHAGYEHIIEIFSNNFFANNATSDFSMDEDTLINGLKRVWMTGYKINLIISTQGIIYLLNV